MKEGGKTYMDQQQMESINRIALFIRALNHPLRQEILALLDENKDNTKKLIVNDIRKNVRQEQSVVSQHLAILLRV